MRLSVLPILALSALLSLGACSGTGTGDQSGSSSSSLVSSSSSAVPSDSITVSSPLPDATVSSPLVVTGQARGSWYFEASFPVHLLDANGTEIVSVPAEAQGNWMTDNFVPFKATLTFPPPTTPTGTLVLENDNPSGDPARSMQISIPVRF